MKYFVNITLKSVESHEIVNLGSIVFLDYLRGRKIAYSQRTTLFLPSLEVLNRGRC